MLVKDGTNVLAASAANVVAGDVLVINGQSNAEARMWNGSANGNRHPFVRSFGCRTETASLFLDNLKWTQDEGDAIEGLGAVGQWGLRMGRVLMESNGIPVAIINGGRGGAVIGYFLRNDSKPENVDDNYGRVLYRLRRAGLDHVVRAIFYYQGETDSQAGVVHEAGFLNLYRNWLKDYPSVEKIYVCQLHTSLYNPVYVPQWRLSLREYQRTFQDRVPRLRTISTTGIPQHTDNLHYAYASGHRFLGEQIARVVLRDLYGADLPTAVESPNLDYAWFSDGTGSNVTIRTRNGTDVLGFPTDNLACFRVEGATNTSYVMVRQDGVVIGSTYAAAYIDDTVVTGRVYGYQLAAVNPFGTSAWSEVLSAAAYGANVFAAVPDARDYHLLYQLDIPAELSTGAGGDVPYSVDRSAVYTQGIRRVAYCLELQDAPGNPVRWAYASMDAFSTDPRLLGVPVRAKGAIFQQRVTNMNVYVGAGSGVTPARGLQSGNIEFWGEAYLADTAAGIPNASGGAYDCGDSRQTSGDYGSPQVHNHAVNGTTNTQTIIAYNRWGVAAVDEVGVGNSTGANRDWTLTGNALNWNVKRLSVLVLADADADSLPDAWEQERLGTLDEGPADDPDGDGVLNRDEHLAGTDPGDPDQWPKVLMSRVPDQRHVSFSAAVDRIYAIDRSTSLPSHVWTETGLSVTGGDGIVSLPVTNAGSADFFRLRITPP
jgi:hypothetical protein